MSKGGKQGRVVSVQSVAEVQDVPVSIVLVLDNSFSMHERNAVKELLSGVDKVLKVVRPIDQVHMVVFAKKGTTKVGDRNLNVQTFKSSNVNQLRDFANKAYSRRRRPRGPCSTRGCWPVSISSVNCRLQARAS